MESESISGREEESESESGSESTGGIGECFTSLQPEMCHGKQIFFITICSTKN